MATKPATEIAPITIGKSASDMAAQVSVFAENQFTLAETYVIDSQEMYEAAADDLRTIEAAIKKAEARRLDITRPLDAAKKSVMDLFRGPVARLEAASAAIRGKMVTFSNEQRRKADEERREAERLEAERIADLERKAAKAKSAAKREELQQQIEEAQVAPLPAVQTEAPKAAGVSGRSTWKVSSIDLPALITACAQRLANGDSSLVMFLEANSTELAAVARALKRNTNIPGVTVEEVHSLAVRS